MSEWLSVKCSLPHERETVEVRKAHGGVLSPVRRVSLKDTCLITGTREIWVYRSGLFAGAIDDSDVYKHIN